MSDSSVIVNKSESSAYTTVLLLHIFKALNHVKHS